jgi:hypothetical protein
MTNDERSELSRKNAEQNERSTGANGGKNGVFGGVR